MQCAEVCLRRRVQWWRRGGEQTERQPGIKITSGTVAEGLTRNWQWGTASSPSLGRHRNDFHALYPRDFFPAKCWRLSGFWNLQQQNLWSNPRIRQRISVTRLCVFGKYFRKSVSPSYNLLLCIESYTLMLQIHCTMKILFTCAVYSRETVWPDDDYS